MISKEVVDSLGIFLNLGDTVFMLWHQFDSLVDNIVKEIVILDACIAMKEKTIDDVGAVKYNELCDVLSKSLLLQIVLYDLKYIG